MRIAGCFVLSLGALAAWAAPPDFTGVWGNLESRGMRGGQGITVVEQPPLLPEARRRVDAYNALVGPVGLTPGGVCLGYGTPQATLVSGGYPMEIVQRPDQVTFLFEAHGEVRRVYLGDRVVPQEDRVPGRNGYSVGRWEGETLVVETDNLTDGVDQRMTPHSDAATVVERYRLEGVDDRGRRILAVDIELSDPKFYPAPVRLTKRWAEIPNGRVLPYECNEELWLERIEQLAREAGVELP